MKFERLDMASGGRMPVTEVAFRVIQPLHRGIFRMTRGCLPAVVFAAYPGQELNLTTAEVEGLLVDLILDQRLHGKIDQIDGFLLLQDSKQTSSSRKHEALGRWGESLRSLTGHISERVNS